MINPVLFKSPIHPNVIFLLVFISVGFMTVREECFVLQNLVLVCILIDSLLSLAVLLMFASTVWRERTRLLTLIIIMVISFFSFYFFFVT